MPLDTALGVAAVVRALYVAGTDDSILPNQHDERVRNLDIVASLGLAAIFLGSAFYGDRPALRCGASGTSSTQAKNQRQPGGQTADGGQLSLP